MAMLHQQKLQLKKTGVSVSIASNPKAKLMYYLKCMSQVLDADSLSESRRILDHQNYGRLTETETDALLLLCILLSPDELLNKCIFCAPQLCGDSNNEFFELSQVSNTLFVARTIFINGQHRRVMKIMTFKENWLRTYYLEPIIFYKSRIERIARTGSGVEPESRCTIL